MCGEDFFLERNFRLAASQIGLGEQLAALGSMNRKRPAGALARDVIQRDLRRPNLVHGHDARVEPIANQNLNFAGFGLILPNDSIGMHLFSPGSGHAALRENLRARVTETGKRAARRQRPSGVIHSKDGSSPLYVNTRF